MDIHSNSQESNFQTLKEQIRCVCSEYDGERLIEDIEHNIKLFKIDENKYAGAILRNIAGKEMSSPYAYIKKVAWTLANERHNEFIKDYLPNFTELHLKFDEIGMTGDEWEKYLIDEIVTHCLTNFPIETEEMINTLRAIVDYCVSRNSLTYHDYLRYLMASKAVKKCNVPLSILEDRAKNEYEEFSKLLKEYENGKINTETMGS